MPTTLLFAPSPLPPIFKAFRRPCVYKQPPNIVLFGFHPRNSWIAGYAEGNSWKTLDFVFCKGPFTNSNQSSYEISLFYVLVIKRRNLKVWTSSLIFLTWKTYKILQHVEKKISIRKIGLLHFLIFCRKLLFSVLPYIFDF